jgi:hypothetical protein
LELFFALGFGIYSFYSTIDNLFVSGYVLNSDKFFKNTVIKREDSSKLFDLVAISRDQFREKHMGKYGNNCLGNYFDFTVLRQYPLIKLEDTIYVPSDTRFLAERITSRVYWDIFDNLVDMPKFKYATFFGELLQEYVSNIFQRIYPETRASSCKLFLDVEYEGKRASDAILFYGNESVFIEVTVGRLRMEETAITGDLTAFKKDITTKIVDSAKQLDRVIREFQSKKLNLFGVTPKDIRTYYPLIITLSPLPLFMTTYTEVRSLISQSGYLNDPNISDVEFMSLGELENLEPLLEKGLTLAEILKEKINDKFYRAIPVWHYVYMKYSNKMAEYRNDYQSKCLREIYDKVTPLLFPTNNSEPLDN